MATDCFREVGLLRGVPFLCDFAGSKSGSIVLRSLGLPALTKLIFLRPGLPLDANVLVWWAHQL